MKLIVLNVLLSDQLETPSQQLAAGEFIVRRVVQLSRLNDELRGIIPVFYRMWSMIIYLPSRLRGESMTAYCVLSVTDVDQGFIIDARLSHFASGYEMALRLNEGKFI